MSSAALPEPARAASAAAAPRAHRRERGGGGFLAKFVAIGFWGAFASMIVGAVASAGLLLLFAVPLLGLGYLVFCWIALTGDRNVE